jgi:AbrB family looped-hinge helix DNA binding protein
MKSVKATVSESGRLSLPAEFRKALGLERGGAVVIELEGNEIRIHTPAEGLRRAQKIARQLLPKGTRGSTVDEFLAERRREAKREDRDP